MEGEGEPVLDREQRIAARRKRIEEKNVVTSEQGAAAPVSPGRAPPRWFFTLLHPRLRQRAHGEGEAG
eukprot:scaffold19525_cov26-Tisochrysis_lutea.AAC.1